MIDKGYVVVYNEGVGGSSPRKLSELKVGAADSGSGLQSVQAGTNITIDNTDPQNPTINATGGGGSYLGDVTKSVGIGGDFETLTSLMAFIENNRGRIITINVISDLLDPSDENIVITNTSWDYLRFYNPEKDEVAIPLGTSFVGANSGMEIEGGFNLASDATLTNVSSSGSGIYFYNNHVLTIKNCKNYEGELSITTQGNTVVRDSVLTSLVSNGNVSIFDSSVTYETRIGADGKSLTLIGNNYINRLDFYGSTTATGIYVDNATATTIAQINGDENISDIIESGKTINTFNNWGYVTVANK